VVRIWPPYVQEAMQWAMPFSFFFKKKEGRPSLTGAAGERSQVRTLEQEAPVAVNS